MEGDLKKVIPSIPCGRRERRSSLVGKKKKGTLRGERGSNRKRKGSSSYRRRSHQKKKPEIGALAQGKGLRGDRPQKRGLKKRKASTPVPVKGGGGLSSSFYGERNTFRA